MTNPTCDTCGVTLTTGLMAAICPRRERCEFWPEDEESQQFLDSFGWRAQTVGASTAAKSENQPEKS